MNAVLRQAVAKAHRQLERRIRAYLTERRLQVSCGKGCCACCSAWVVVGLAEAEYLWEALEAHHPQVLARAKAEGQKRLERIRREKHRPEFPTLYFLEANPCPLLTSDGACSVHPYRPLACRGVLTNLSPRYCAPGVVLGLRGREKAAYLGQLRSWHGPEHYLRAPWQLSEHTAQRLWATEQHVRGFTVIGELASLVYLRGLEGFRKALEQGPASTKRWLESQDVLGGAWGFWVG